MARQDTYKLDENITGSDKFLAVDADNGSSVNISIDQVAKYFARTGDADGVRLGFHYNYEGEYSSDAQPAKAGDLKITFDSDANTKGYSSVTNIYVRTTDSTQKSIIPVTTFLQGAIIVLANTDEVDERGYGLYRIETVSTASNVTQLTVKYLNSRGNFIVGNTGIGIYQAGALDVTTSQFLSGPEAPDNADGENGDFYLDYETPTDPVLYGPKEMDDWGEGVSLVGPEPTVQSVDNTTLNPNQTPNANVESDDETNDLIFTFDLPRAAAVTVGDVLTGAAGSNVLITNSGTNGDVTLNFTIPQGDKGEAATITAGTTTTGAAGTNASVTNSGDSTNAVFDFTIPKGDTGAAATIAVGTTTTGDAGTDAAVSNSGNSSAAIFDFTIPKGDKGDPGALSAVTVNQPVTKIDPGGTPTATADFDAENESIAFNFGLVTGDKGEKGDSITGVSQSPSASEVQDGEDITVSFYTGPDLDELASTVLIPSGTDGVDGAYYAEIVIYRRSAGTPGTPADTTFTVGSSGITFTVPTDWSQQQPAGSNSLYSSRAEITGAGYEDVTASWSTPEILIDTSQANITVEEGSTQVSSSTIEFVGSNIELEQVGGKARVTIHGGGGAITEPSLSALTESGFTSNQFDNVDQDITFSCTVTYGDSDFVSTQFTGSDAEFTDQTAVTTRPAGENASDTFTYNPTAFDFTDDGEIVVTFTYTYTESGESTQMTKTMDLTLNPNKTKPTPKTYLSNPQDFELTPAGNHIEEYDSGRFTIAADDSEPQQGYNFSNEEDVVTGAYTGVEESFTITSISKNNTIITFNTGVNNTFDDYSTGDEVILTVGSNDYNVTVNSTSNNNASINLTFATQAESDEVDAANPSSIDINDADRTRLTVDSGTTNVSYDREATITQASVPSGKTAISEDNYHLSNDSDWTRIKSLRVGSKPSAAFTATELQTLSDFNDLDNRDMYFREVDPNNVKITLLANAGEYLYIMYDSNESDLDLAASVDHFGGDLENDIGGGFTKQANVGGFKIYQSTNPSKQLRAADNYTVTLKT